MSMPDNEKARLLDIVLMDMKLGEDAWRLRLVAMREAMRGPECS